MKSFSFNYKVRLDDLDFMGIIGNAEWVTLLTRARIDLLEKIEFPFSEMKKQKIGGVVADLSIKFKKPGFFGDNLKITIMPTNPLKKGLTLKYSVENQNFDECLTAETQIVFVNETGIPVNMPEKLANNLFGSTVQN